MYKVVSKLACYAMIGTVVHAAEPTTTPSPPYQPMPVIAQNGLTRRQVKSLMKALGFELQDAAPKMLGPDAYTEETWAKPLADGSTLKILSLSEGPSHSSLLQLRRLSFRGIPTDSARPATSRPSQEPSIVDEYELTPKQVASLMNVLGFERERTERHRDEGAGGLSNYDLEVWKKSLPDGGTLRFLIRMSHVMGPTTPEQFSFQGIPVR
jgi:hypothetical protein